MWFWFLVHFTKIGFYYITAAWMRLLCYFSVHILCKEVKISKSLWAWQGKNLSHSLWYSLGCIQQILGFSKCLLNWTNSPSLSLSLLCTFPITLVLSSGCQLLFTSLHPGFLWVKTLQKLINSHIFGIASLNEMGSIKINYPYINVHKRLQKQPSL